MHPTSLKAMKAGTDESFHTKAAKNAKVSLEKTRLALRSLRPSVKKV
jgi:hypothetical protein